MANSIQTANKSMIIFAYAVVYLVWGSTFFFIHKALSDFTPFVLGSLRFLSASVLLMTYCKMKGYKLFNKKVSIMAPVTGRCVDLSHVPDEVFSQKTSSGT